MTYLEPFIITIYLLRFYIEAAIFNVLVVTVENAVPKWIARMRTNDLSPFRAPLSKVEA
jgi:hypothetical protein